MAQCAVVLMILVSMLPWIVKDEVNVWKVYEDYFFFEGDVGTIKMD